MTKKFLIIAAAVTVLFAGCKLSSASGTGSAGSAVGATTSMAKSIEFKVVSSGLQRGIRNQQLWVITSDKQFASLASLAKLSGNKPKVDFSKDELIGVFLGSNVGCGTDGLKINSVKETDATVTVYASRIAHKSNAAGGGCTRMPLNGFSYALISIPKTSKTISLVFN